MYTKILEKAIVSSEIDEQVKISTFNFLGGRTLLKMLIVILGHHTEIESSIQNVFLGKMITFLKFTSQNRLMLD